MRSSVALFVLLAPLACGRTDLPLSSDEDTTSTGGRTSSSASGGGASRGGRAPGTGGKLTLSSGGSLATGGDASGGSSSSGSSGAGGAGGSATSGGSSSGLGGAGGEKACGCEIELDSTGEPRTCDMFGGTLGSSARVWVCLGLSTPPFGAFEAAGCEGLPTGVYRSCCPPEVDSADICSN